MTVSDIINPQPLNSYKEKKGKTNRYGQAIETEERFKDLVAGEPLVLGSEKKVAFCRVGLIQKDKIPKNHDGMPI